MKESNMDDQSGSGTQLYEFALGKFTKYIIKAMDDRGTVAEKPRRFRVTDSVNSAANR